MVTGVVPHVGGPVFLPGCPTVLIGSMPAARMTDLATCVGPPDVIAMGSSGVFIGSLCAARMTDSCSHGGKIILGCFTVLIGDGGGGPATLSAADAFQISMQAIADGVNPENGTINCGQIIDAVTSRLDGTDPDATVPRGRDGSFDDIADRYDTDIEWGNSFDDAFDAVRDGGDGTTAIIGIDYRNGNSHVVTMTNQDGQVGIIEGQDGGAGGQTRGVVTNADDARARYGAGSDVGIGMVGSRS